MQKVGSRYRAPGASPAEVLAERTPQRIGMPLGEFGISRVRQVDPVSWSRIRRIGPVDDAVGKTAGRASRSSSSRGSSGGRGRRSTTGARTRRSRDPMTRTSRRARDGSREPGRDPSLQPHGQAASIPICALHTAQSLSLSEGRDWVGLKRARGVRVSRRVGRICGATARGDRSLPRESFGVMCRRAVLSRSAGSVIGEGACLLRGEPAGRLGRANVP